MTPRPFAAGAAVVGIFSPERSFTRETAAHALGWEDAGSVLAAGPLGVAHADGRAGRSGEVECVVVGDVWNAAEIIGEPRSPARELPELLASAYAEHGPMFLRPLRGSFVIVLYDVRRRRALVAGDHFGSYSVYRAQADGDVFFASEPELLLRTLPRRPRPDSRAIVASLSGGGVPGFTTFYDGVTRVANGAWAQIEPGRLAELPYWRPEYTPPEWTSRAELVSHLWDHVESAIDSRLAHGGSTAVMMSGGVDSSTVVAAAARRRQPGDTVTGYAAVFPDYPDIDESDRITALAAATGVPAVQLRIEPRGLLRVGLDFIDRWGVGLPIAGYLIEHETLRQAAADGATVALDGQGGDETFGLWRYAPSELLRRGRLIESWRAVQRTPGGHSRRRRVIGRAWRDVVLPGALPHAVHARLPGLGVAGTPPFWLKAEHARWYVDTADTWQWKRRSAPLAWSYIADLIAGPARHGLAEYLRRRAASLGLEARPPLLDVDLTEFVLRQPPNAGFDPFVDRPLIREALLHLVPDSVRLHRRKSDLSGFFFDSVMADLSVIRRLFSDRDARALEFVDRSQLEQLLAEPPSRQDHGVGRWSTALWTITSLELWLRREDHAAALDEIRDCALSEPHTEVYEPDGPPAAS